ncbi:MAG: hypothetical protein ACMXYK_03760 [Candidatus Woesearchaeota archaeon]
MASYLSESMQFLRQLGLFDVVLPFLLIYVMMFALMERTKIFGTEADGKTPKTNLNAMFSFAVSFFAIGTARVVGVINKAIGPVMIFLLSIVLFLLLVSVFQKDGMKEFSSKWMVGFTIAILLIITLIFLGSITTSRGTSWLEVAWNFIFSLGRSSNSGAVGAVLLLLIVGGMIAWISGGSSKPKDGD